MKSMCCLCIQFTHENTSERTILHQVSKKNSGGGGGGKHHQTPPFPGMVDCTAKKASYAPATICDKVYQWLAADRWVSPGTPPIKLTTTL